MSTGYPKAACRAISRNQEPAAFETLETEFAKGRGTRTTNILLDGKVKCHKQKQHARASSLIPL